MQILFRCDATEQIGLGHVSRCLALAEALAETGYLSRFVGRFEAGAGQLLSHAGLPFSTAMTAGSPTDLAHTVAEAADAQVVVLDSYSVDDDYVAGLDRQVGAVFLIDDFCRLKRYECTALLNFTVDASNLNYPSDGPTCFLGPEYLLVRRRLRELRASSQPRTKAVQRILVAMGGVDPGNLSSRVVNVLWDIAPSVTVRVAVGSAYPYIDLLRSGVERFGGDSRVMIQLDDLADELTAADLCVCSGGLTKYETSYMGVPCAVLSHTRDQAAETAHFVRRGLAIDLGWSSDQSRDGLVAGLRALIANDAMRESISRNGLTCFPADPTVRAAEAVLRVASRSRG